MIEIEQLIESDKGRGVIYRSKGGDKVEEGVITSWNDTFIFVRYGAEKQSKATSPEDLEFEFPLVAPKSNKDKP